MQKVDESAIEVHFDGYIEEQWHDHYHSVRHKNYNPVMAIPYDLYVSGMDGKGISVLRIWRAEANEFDMKLFNSGNYMRAMEQKARQRPSQRSSIRKITTTRARVCALHSSTSSFPPPYRTSYAATCTRIAPLMICRSLRRSTSMTRTPCSPSRSSCASCSTNAATSGTRLGYCDPHHCVHEPHRYERGA